MYKILFHLKTMNSLSSKVLRCTVLIWITFVFSYAAISCTYRSLSKIDLTLALCFEQYPMIIMVSLCVGITGALLIDIYEKTHKDC